MVETPRSSNEDSVSDKDRIVSDVVGMLHRFLKFMPEGKFYTESIDIDDKFEGVMGFAGADEAGRIIL